MTLRIVGSSPRPESNFLKGGKMKIDSLPKLDKAIEILEFCLELNPSPLAEALVLLKAHREELLCFINRSLLLQEQREKEQRHG